MTEEQFDDQLGKFLATERTGGVVTCSRCKSSHYKNDAWLVAPNVWVCKSCGLLLLDELETRYNRMVDDGRIVQAEDQF